MTDEENLNNLKKCPRFNFCSIPKCPLDFWIEERIELPREEKCSLMIKYKTREEKQRGRKVPLRGGCLSSVPMKNLKMLSSRYQKQWSSLRKKPQLPLF